MQKTFRKFRESINGLKNAPLDLLSKSIDGHFSFSGGLNINLLKQFVGNLFLTSISRLRIASCCLWLSKSYNRKELWKHRRTEGGGTVLRLPLLRHFVKDFTKFEFLCTSLHGGISVYRTSAPWSNRALSELTIISDGNMDTHI